MWIKQKFWLIVVTFLHLEQLLETQQCALHIHPAIFKISSSSALLLFDKCVHCGMSVTWCLWSRIDSTTTLIAWARGSARSRSQRNPFVRARAREISARERKVNALTCDADGTRNRASNVRDKRSSARPRNPSTSRVDEIRPNCKRTNYSPPPPPPLAQGININRYLNLYNKSIS